MSQVAIAHLTGTDAARVRTDAALGATKPPSTEQLAKLTIGRKRAAMSGRSKRADRKLRKF